MAPGCGGPAILAARPAARAAAGWTRRRRLRHHAIVSRQGWTMHLAFRMATVVALWLAFGTAFAQRVEGDAVPGARGMYESEVKVNGQGESERNTAFARALSGVLAKLTGTRSVAGLPGVGQELRHARDY